MTIRHDDFDWIGGATLSWLKSLADESAIQLVNLSNKEVRETPGDSLKDAP